MNTARSERIYQWWLTHQTRDNKKWSYAAIARMFHCSREWVRVVIEREEKKREMTEAKAKRAGLLDRAYQIAAENMNGQDSLVER